jgi:muramoyltetrapeptide carboxypeptidase LdcA involved in peptidoglycan recycling
MTIRFPAPLRPGDRVGVTSPSKGVERRERDHLAQAVSAVRSRGYDVVIGECMDGTAHTSAPAEERAAELMAMLTDPRIRAVVPPRGGETAIDLLPLLDWASVAAADPTWFVGFSDISTLLLPMTVRTGIATLHTNNLMNTPYKLGGPGGPGGPGAQVLTWPDIIAFAPGASFTQGGRWVRLDGDGPADVTGRLVGGCIEAVRHLAGTPHGDVARFARQHAPEGLIIYLEAAGDDAFSVCRSLHGMRLAGFFAGAKAILVASTLAPDSPTLTQHQAVIDALARVGVPIIAEVGCGHVPPYVPMVNGALGHLEFGAGSATLTQSLR